VITDPQTDDPLPAPDAATARAAARTGIVLTPDERERAADVSPNEGFAAAADTALALLQERFGMDMWLVTEVRDGYQRVVVARGVAGMPVPLGAVERWTETYCSRMIAGEGPRVAPRVRDVPAYADAPASRRHRVGAYVGVPLLADDGTLFGTICGLSVNEQPASLGEGLSHVEGVARLLSTVLAKETAALERSLDAASAYALADRDPLTGLLNQRGWEARLTTEEARCVRHERDAAVAVLSLQGLREVNVEQGHEAGDAMLRSAAQHLRGACRPQDTLARLGGNDFCILAVECDAESVRVLAARLAEMLEGRGLEVTVAVSGRSASRSLLQAWREASSG
jgi:diguanylate cyclase